MSKQKTRPLTKSFSSFFKEKWSQKLKIRFYAVYGHYGAIWAPKKLFKGPQVHGMLGPMSELKNKPLIKSLGPFF
jgi:hypothetical protein